VIQPPAGDALMAALRREGLDSVDGAFAYGAGRDVVKPGLRHRRRTRLELTDDAGVTQTIYLKRYGRERIMDRLWRWYTYGRRRSPAGVEFHNIRAARAAGLPTMEAVCYGEEFHELAGFISMGSARSYVVVTAVPGDALERCCEEFLARHADSDEVVVALTEKLADLAREFHEAGFVHRDFYASHIFLDQRDGRTDLYLIDLARMFSPRRRFRWRVKDLAQLKYSMPPAWVERFWQTFAARYFAGADSARRSYERAIGRKVSAMRRARRRGPTTRRASEADT